MEKVLITGGTQFVSRFAAEWFLKRGYDVYVLNRGTRRQVDGVNLICADRNNLQGALKDCIFDCVIDICAYTRSDVQNLAENIGGFKTYVFISSSAVYPETNLQPFKESQSVGANKIWGNYGENKIQAEEYIKANIANYYILRPPYIYGEYQNLYREPFVFDCAEQNRKFYIPADGKMKLQFLHVEDLCRFIEIVIQQQPQNRIFNVGNNEICDINKYVELCYKAVGAPLEKVYVKQNVEQRDYFCFYDYEYVLDVSLQNKLTPHRIPLEEGIKREYVWYKNNIEQINKKKYAEFIDENLTEK